MANWTVSGTYTALVTPFEPGGERIDFGALERLVDAQLAGGVAGLVACGTTGETPTLNETEQQDIIACVVKASAGKARVVAGTGTFSTAKSITASKAALAAGADAVMLVMPYYNKPSQDGMREHVLAVAQAVDCPIVLYNIPGRSVVDLAPHTTETICEKAPNVIALKDATGNVLRCQQLKQRLGERLNVMCGDDALTVPMMAAGASGVISVSSNVLPAQVTKVTQLMAQGELGAARQAHFELLALHAAMFLEPNPVPCKLALSLLGSMQPDVRLPLIQAGTMAQGRIAATLQELGLLPRDDSGS